MSNNLQVKLLVAVIISIFKYGEGKMVNDSLVTLADGGKVRGNCNDKYCTYTNIPYAEPPIGNLRFEEPQPAKSWKGIRDARSTPDKCIQFNKGMHEMSGKENCLFIHINKPKKLKGPCRVVIYLHPGLFQSGGCDFSPDIVMTHAGAIWVCIGYRLGPIGLMSTGDKRMPGNNGLKDQRQGIDWVFKNIRCFGGDPSNILLLGVEAGAASAEYHKTMDTNHIKAYAHLSGSVHNPWAYHENPEIPTQILCDKVKCPIELKGKALINCLKKVKIEHIWSAVMNMYKYEIFNAAPFRPTKEPENVPGAFIKHNPQKLIKLSKNTKKKSYFSVVLNEGAPMAASFLRLDPFGVEKIEELNKIYYKVCIYLFMLEEESKSNQYRICHFFKKFYMDGKRFNMASFKHFMLMIGDGNFYRGIERSMLLHIAAKQNIYLGVGNIPTRYSSANLISKRNELKFGCVHAADALSILPISLNLPQEPTNPKRSQTNWNFIEFLLSLLSDGPPIYNGTEVPYNNNNKDDYKVLYFTDGFHNITLCSKLRLMIANVTGSLDQDV